MGELKIGDRVRYVGRNTHGLTNGKIYDVVDISWDGETPMHLDDDGDIRDRTPGDYELVEPATEELATLRAFREQALARYPDLAEPESDEDAVERLVQNYYENDQMVDELVRDAIAWARANPR